MPQYRYEMRSSGNETSVGVLSAENAMAAAQQIRGQGHQLLNLTPVATAKSAGSRLRALNQPTGPGARDILNFTSQLAVMIRAGISIRAAIEGIELAQERGLLKDLLLEPDRHRRCERLIAPGRERQIRFD